MTLNWFNSLLTKSLNENNPAFLYRVPEILLNETQKEALEYIRDYSEQYGTMPDIARFELTDYAIFINKSLITSPFQDLLEKALHELKANYLFNAFNKFDVAVRSKDLNANDIIVNAAEIVGKIEVSEVNDAHDIKFPIFSKMYGTAIATGIPYFDEAVGGLFPGKLNLIFAPTGNGKTYLMSYIAAYNLLQGKSILVVRGEMLEEEYIARVMGICCGFNADDKIREAAKNLTKAIELDTMCKKFLEYLKSIGAGLYFTKDPMPHMGQVKQAYRRTKADIILIDGLYALPTRQKYAQDHERQSGLSAQIRTFCKQGITIDGVKHYPRIFASTQMNREGMKSSVPGNENVGGSISYTQDADTVWSLKFSGISFSNSDFDFRQTKARSNAPVAGVMHIDWSTMKFGFSSSQFPKLDVQDGLAICGFDAAEML